MDSISSDSASSGCNIGYYSCVRIRPTQRNLSRLKNKLQAMLGSDAWSDDPQMKIAAMNRVLRGWANYYKAVNSYQQFRTGDFLAERLFRQWYRRKYHIGVRKYLSEVLAERKSGHPERRRKSRTLPNDLQHEHAHLDESQTHLEIQVNQESIHQPGHHCNQCLRGERRPNHRCAQHPTACARVQR